MKLKSLKCDLVTSSDICRLHSVNVQTSEQLLTYADLDKLSQLTCIPLRVLKSLKKYIIGNYSPLPECAKTLLDKYTRRRFLIHTGSHAIDSLVANGICSSEVSELSGDTSTGKTELCLNLIANMLVAGDHAAATHKCKCLYVDSTGGNFSPARLKHLLEHKLHKATHDSLLDKLLRAVHVVTCRNVYHLLDTLYAACKGSSSTTPNLLIIDNLAHMFAIFRATSHNVDALFMLTYAASYLKHLAVQANVAVVVVTTSEARRSLTTTSKYSDLFDTPLWKSVPTLIACLKRTSGGGECTRHFELLKCNRAEMDEPHPRTSCSFTIGEHGLS